MQICLQTPLSDSKMIGVFTSKIHLSNLRSARRQVNQSLNYGRDADEPRMHGPPLLVTVGLCARFSPDEGTALSLLAVRNRKRRKQAHFFFVILKGR